MYLALERYSRPHTVAECLELYEAPGTALLAGGTELNAGGHEDLTHVIDLQALPLGGIALRGDQLHIGAGVTLGRLRRDPALDRPPLAALREAAAAFASVPIQNRATVGGRIASNRSDQDLPPALLALGARVHLARLRGGRVEETVIDYPTGLARSVLPRALITGVSLPLDTAASALRRCGRTAVDVPLATCAAARHPGGVRLAANVQGFSAAALARLPASEALVAGWGAGRPEDWRAQARAALLGELKGYADARASGDYRRDLAATLMVRALAAVFGEEEIR
jgi:xanthine dehydrogenase small subunit